MKPAVLFILAIISFKANAYNLSCQGSILNGYEAKINITADVKSHDSITSINLTINDSLTRTAQSVQGISFKDKMSFHLEGEGTQKDYFDYVFHLVLPNKHMKYSRGDSFKADLAESASEDASWNRIQCHVL